MSNFTPDRERNEEPAIDSHNRRHPGLNRTTGSNQSSQQRSQQPSSKSRLAEDRIFGRRAGFIGFSIIAHIALLAGIMMNSNLIPAIRDVGGGDGSPQGTPGQIAAEPGSEAEISIVEINDSHLPLAPIAPPVAAESTVPVAQVKTAPISPTAPLVTAKPHSPKPTQKALTPSTLSAAQPLAPTTNDAESTTAPAVIVDSNSDINDTVADDRGSQPDTTTSDTEASDTPPTLLAAPPSDEPEETTIAEPVAEEPKAAPAAEPAAQSASEPAAQPVSEPAAQPVSESAAQPVSESAAQSVSEPAAQPETAAAPTNAAAGTGKGGDEGGNGAGIMINGPIRDAGELRAMPGNPNPVYPVRDRLKRVEGTSVVVGQILADGRVGRVILEKSSGSKEMDLESARTFKVWRFQAGQAGWVRKPFQFRLVGNAKEVPAPLGKVLKRDSSALGR